MDEGRLAVVFRQEEQHRKFVYMMNDIVRARLGLYTNCLAREQHESSVKLLKNCSEMRRSVVRQKVLRKCLEMRKRTITDQDPCRSFGQYGGTPLWAMSRDIDRVIASNHPKIRRMKRVEEVMKQSRENGTILDEEAVSRRIEAFFQLKHAQHHHKQKKDVSPERAQDIFKAQVPRRNFFKPPSWAVDKSSETVPQVRLPSESVQLASSTGRSGQPKHDVEIVRKESVKKGKLPKANNTPTKEVLGKETHRHKNSNAVGVASNVSLDVDSKGRLQGIRTNTSNKEGAEAEHRKPKNVPLGDIGADSGRSPAGSRRTQQADVLTISQDSETEGEEKKLQYRVNEDNTLVRSRSKLILPPIESTKALVARR